MDIHLSDSLIDISILWQRADLVRRELQDAHVSLLGADLGLDDIDLLLRNERARLDLLDYL